MMRAGHALENVQIPTNYDLCLSTIFDIEYHAKIEACTFLIESIDADPVSDDYDKKEYAGFHASRGEAYFAQNNFSKALLDFNEALELLPHDVDLLFARATTFYRLDDYESSIADVNRILKLSPEDTESLYLRALALAQTHEFDLAIEDIEGIISDDPQYGAAYDLRSVIHMFTENYQAAAADAELLIENGWAHSGNYYLLIKVYATSSGKLRNPKRALDLAKEMLLSSRSYRTSLYYSIAQMSAGEFDSALLTIKDIRENHSTDRMYQANLLEELQKIAEQRETLVCPTSSLCVNL